MSTVTVCRVCLVNNLNLYAVRNDLQTAYEKITREKYNKVGYPLSMCYICLSVLHKSHRFRETARDTNKLLKQWYKQQNEVPVVKPLSIFSVTKAELVSIEHKGALDHDIKTEVDPEPDQIEDNTYLDVEKTDMDEQTDISNSPNDSTFNDTVEYDDDTQSDPLSHNNIDIESSLALELDDTKIVTIIKSTSHDNDVPFLMKHKLNETKPNCEGPETSGGTAATIETSHDITPLDTPQPQPENKEEGKTKIKTTFDKNNRNKKETAKLNKIVKEVAVRNKTKKIINTVKNVKNLNKLTIKPGFTEKTEINKTTTTPGNTAVTVSMLNVDINKRIDLYKYCEVCNFKCITKDDLAKHMRLHDNSRPHGCDVCHYRFDNLPSLNSHKAVVHKIGTTKKYFCDTCNYKSFNKFHMTEHVRIHTGEKPFTCNICDHKFGSKTHLKKHMRTHTGEKPYSCNICDHKFSEKHNLKTHLRIHTGEKPFACNICSYKCAQQKALKSHMTTHTTEKPFFCEICDYKSKEKRHLIRHMITHTGEKPFSCDKCDYKCNYKNNLCRHLLTKHKIK